MWAVTQRHVSTAEAIHYGTILVTHQGIRGIIINLIYHIFIILLFFICNVGATDFCCAVPFYS